MIFSIFAEAGRDYELAVPARPQSSISLFDIPYDKTVHKGSKEAEGLKPTKEKERLMDDGSAYLLEAELSHQAGEMGQYAYDSGDSENEANIDLHAYRTSYAADEDKSKQKEEKKSKRDQRGYQGNREKHAFQKVARLMEDKYGDKVETAEKKSKKQKR